MFRIKPYVSTARTLLRHRTLLDNQIACISASTPHWYQYTDPRERDPCPPPPPPKKPPPKDDSLFWGAMTLVFLAGGFAVYAKQHPETRDWLTINAPWFDDMIAVFYEENMSYKQFILKSLEDAKALIFKMINVEKKPRECLTEEEKNALMELPCDEDEGDGELVEAESQTACEKLEAPVVTKDICEVEKCIKELGDCIIENVTKARDVCRHFNKFVEEKSLIFTMAGLREMQELMETRICVVDNCSATVKQSKKKFDQLAKYLECGVAAPKDAIENTRGLIAEYRNKIKILDIELIWENDKSVVVDRQIEMVANTINNYVEQNKTMFPNLNYEAFRPVLNGDVDLLLHHSLRYLRKLRADLDDAAVSMSERVNRAYDTVLPQDPQKKKANDLEVQNLFRKRKAELDRWYSKRLDEQKANNDKLLKDMSEKQRLKHQELVKLRVAQKEVEANKKLAVLVAERVESEKQLFARQLRDMRNKLMFVEDKLNARLKAERETRRSQALWSAGASLLAATKRGDNFVNVDKELNAIENATGDGDKLVITVLKAIPRSVRDDGVVPESVLREQYHSMERVALSVALVEQEGAPLPVYLLSWLQSLVLFMKISGIPREEAEKVPKEPDPNLDTFDLLQRARYWIERGNIAAALRYVTALQGASRGAAERWAAAARAHVELRQAAEAILAHAAALGLQYV